MLNLSLIGGNVKKYRKAKKYTQAQLAEMVDISTIHLSHIETGSVSMSLECLVNICNALSVSPNDLLLGEYEMTAAAAAKHLETVLEKLTPDEKRLLTDFAGLLEKSKPNRST